jgi:hypothetical protein
VGEAQAKRGGSLTGSPRLVTSGLRSAQPSPPGGAMAVREGTAEARLRSAAYLGTRINSRGPRHAMEGASLDTSRTAVLPTEFEGVIVSMEAGCRSFCAAALFGPIRLASS